MIEPVTLYDSTTISNGGSAILNANRMIPPGNRGMFVRDILFTLNIIGNANFGELNLGAVVRGRLRAGRHDLSNSHVPLWLYGNVPNMLVETIDTEFASFMGVSDAGGRHQFGRYRWVLPKPMYLPPGAALQASFSRVDSVTTLPGGLTGSAITVQMSARGLLLHQRMRTTHVPYVGAFVPITGQMQSLEDDLRNTLNKPIDIHRLMGRMASTNGFTDSVSDLLSGSYRSVVSLGAGAAFAPAYRNLVRIRDDNLQDITDGFVPMCSVFPAQGRAWTFKKKLQPGHQLIASLQNAPVVTAWPMISFIGSREEPA